jgi:hypothetical protein
MLSSRSASWVVPSAFTSACRGDAGTVDADRAGGEERARSTAETDAARYSPLRQIAPANAARLDLAWKYDTRIPEAFETTPIVVGQEAGAKSDLPEESRLIAAYVWAISQTRGEPWPGGHVTHGPEAAQAAQPGRPGS